MSLPTRAIRVVYYKVVMSRPVSIICVLTHLKLTITIIVDVDVLSRNCLFTLVEVADYYASINVFANASPISSVVWICFAIVVS